jgi:hypothetical protein
VDDRQTAFLGDGDTLALSAAMPGLVGATMRSGGVLACFRNTLTHRPKEGVAPDAAGLLKVKLFNLLIVEMGPWFMSRGILVSGQDIRQLLADLSDADWRQCASALLDHIETAPAILRGMDWPQAAAEIGLHVFFEDSMAEDLAHGER